jgi:hypothetical protein
MAELTRRYVVMTMATDAPFDPIDPDGVFVLKPWKDPAAVRALLAYRDNCYPELARDLDAWIRAIEAGSSIRGDVGRRNEPFVKRTTAPRGALEPSRSKRAAKGAPSRGASKKPSAAKGASPRPAARAGARRASGKRKTRGR